MQLYKALRPKIGERESSLLIHFLDANRKSITEENLKTFANRQDLKDEIGLVRADLREEIASVRSDLRSEIASVRSDLRNEIGSVRMDLKNEISSVRMDLKNVELLVSQTEARLTADVKDVTKWMPGIFIVIAGMVLGLYFIK